MKKNMSSSDRIIRVIVAAVFAALYLANTVTGLPGLILMTLAVVFVLTSLIGFCPIYSLLNISTCKVSAH